MARAGTAKPLRAGEWKIILARSQALGVFTQPRPIADILDVRDVGRMRFRRRDLMGLLIAALASAAGARAHTGQQARTGGSKRVPIEFPPFELQASPSALRQLASGLSGWRVERIGDSAAGAWLRSSDGAVWLVAVDQRDVRSMFEVFTLRMLSMGELRARWERWESPALLDEVPEPFRHHFMTRPPAPVAPTDFDPWPLRSWRTEIVRRAEFIIEDADAGPKIGNNPNMQAAARPRAVPPEASAFCEVAAGVLFTGADGRRLLLAVDWMPMNMLVLQDATEIDTFISECELIGMEAYLQRAISTR